MKATVHPMQTSADINGEVEALIGIDMRKTLHRIREYSIAAGKQRAAVEYLEELRKAVLGNCYERHRKAGASQGDADQYARKDDEYLNYLGEIREAREKLAELDAEKYAAMNALELGRSLLAYERTQLNYSGQT